MIPGIVISILTFPGVIVHELAHQIFCRLFNVAVLDVCYFRFGNPTGYVIHEKPKNAATNILIGIGPFFINTIVGAIIALPASISIFKFKMGFDPSYIPEYILIWLGVSICMHAFPSTGDAKSMWKAIKDPETKIITKIIGAPIVLLIYLGAAGSVVWLDLFYGIGVCTFLPNLIVNLLA
ncbi:MAG: DUF3267 domain-containing protein [Clostridiales bacterium]|nr:DUF3267 domain-containing protein [Clostridiales bacterium]